MKVWPGGSVSDKRTWVGGHFTGSLENWLSQNSINWTCEKSFALEFVLLSLSVCFEYMGSF